MWHGRFTEDMNEKVCRFTQSLDLDWRMVQSDIRGSIAHVRMLGRTGLITDAEAAETETALLRIAKEAASGEFVPKESLEDVHMNVEALLIERTGDVGAKLHTGRSRNDQTNTSVRLALRKEILEIWSMMNSLLEVILTKAQEHRNEIVPGYTHLQQAQPISMGQFWMAHFQSFLRDANRLLAAYESADECTLGCGALAGSTLPIDREFTARDLGFSKTAENSMDAIAHRDHLMDFHHFASLFAAHVSRLSEDLIIYFSTEFGWVKLPDAFCTGSSIMPQKKNPDVLELLRGKAGQLTGAYVETLIMLKGTPLTYNRDFQEDKRSLWRSCDTVKLMLDVLPHILAGVSIDREAAERGFEDGYIFATDVAEHLVEQGVPFRKSHEIVGGLVGWCIKQKRSLTSLTPEEWREHVPQAKSELPSLLTPEISVSRRDTFGGTSPNQVSGQIERGRGKLRLIADSFSEYLEMYPK